MKKLVSKLYISNNVYCMPLTYDIILLFQNLLYLSIICNCITVTCDQYMIPCHVMYQFITFTCDITLTIRKYIEMK